MTIDLELCDPSEVGMSAETLALGIGLMQRQFDAGKSPMLVAMVARHGRLVFAHAIGDQRPGGPPLAVDHVFPMASNGKPVAAATLLALVERGLVGLNESITDHLPALSRRDHGQVMVHHLLTHTSGWDDDAFVETIGEVLAAGLSDPPPGISGYGHLLTEAASRTPRLRPPDTEMQYCTLNYTLLGEIIRNATGTTLDAAAREHVFEPLGMDSTGFVLAEHLEDRVIERPDGLPFARGHPDSVMVHTDPGFRGSDDGGMGLHCTAPDLLRFQQMILDGGTVGTRRVLSRDAVRVMTTNQIPGVPSVILGMISPEASWGYGYAVGSASPFMRFRGGTSSRGAVRHGGAGGIASLIDRELGLSIAYFEMVTEWSDTTGPVSWAAHRFEDIVTSAVID